VCLAIILSWNLAAWLFTTSNERFVPMLETAQDGLEIAIALSLFVVIAVWVRRVIPQWRGLRSWRKPVYVLALLVAQLVIIAGFEAAAISARGGIRIFEPHHVGTVIGENGKSAHVYKDSFLTCRYEVYVSGVLSPTMSREMTVARTTCQEPIPQAKWNDDTGRVDLVDADGNKLGSQSSPSGLGSFLGIFASGC